MKCKLSDKKINPFMSFGKMPLANGFLNEEEFKSEYFFNKLKEVKNKLSTKNYLKLYFSYFFSDLTMKISSNLMEYV